MEENEMSVTRALVELKLLDKRINKIVGSCICVSAVMGSQKNTIHNMTKDETKSEMTSYYQKSTDLIKRRNVIKSAIVASNADTKVNIGNKTYTVAEAIERKNSIKYDKLLRDAMTGELAKIQNEVEINNTKMEAQLKSILEKMAESEADKSGSIEETTKLFKNLNEASLYDPLKIKEKIEKLDEEIDTFIANVDTVLSESNAITIISFE